MNLENMQSKKENNLSKGHKSLLVIAILILVGSLIYFYFKKHPPLTPEQKNLKMLLKTIPKDKQPSEADIKSLMNSIPNNSSSSSAESISKTITK